MFISNNDPVKNVVTENPNSKPKITKAEEKEVVKEAKIEAKEELKISKQSKGKEVPAIPTISFDIPMFFEKSNVDIANSIVDQAVELDFNDKSSLIKKSIEFSKSLEGMDNSQLLEVADYIRHLMQETLGTDDILGAFQSTVFDTMKENINTLPMFTTPMIFEKQ
jgi:hypothetical protein